MPRIRSISPKAPKDEDLADCSMAARLVHQWLPMLADRAGRLEDRPKRIKAELFPYDDVDMDELLAELAADRSVSRGPFIVRYESGGIRYIEILRFHKYQNPHNNEPDSIIPEPPKEKTPDKPRVVPDKHSPNRAGLLDHRISGSLDRGLTGIASAREHVEALADDPDPEAAAEAVVSEINRWLPDQRLKLNGLLVPIVNLLLCGHPGGVTKIRSDPHVFTREDLIDAAHGYIVGESGNQWHIDQKARGTPYVFARLVRDAGRVAEYAETGRKVWDEWLAEKTATTSEVEEQEKSLADCQRDHQREKLRGGYHWYCPDACGWTELIQVKVEEPS